LQKIILDDKNFNKKIAECEGTDFAAWTRWRYFDLMLYSACREFKIGMNVRIKEFHYAH